MKNILTLLTVFLFITLAFPRFGSSQAPSTDELRYEVNRIYPYISITKEKLEQAQTLMDLNRYYKESWIKEYVSVEILTKHNGTEKKARSKSDILTQAQKDLMNAADLGKDISVKVRYFPDNTLTHNDVKEIDFAFSISPEKEATYTKGEQQLRQYLKETAIDKIADANLQKSTLAAVRFTVDEKGRIVDSHLFESSREEAIDQLLLDAICNMSPWEPATYSDGTKVKQEFVLTVGNLESCVMGLLNIR